MGRRDRGQATVELALVVPVVVVALLAVVQVALVARDQVLVAHAARAAARAAAADGRNGVARAAAIAAVPLKSARLSTETSYQGGSSGIVRVVVRYRAPTDVPLVGPLFPDVSLRAEAAMWDETDTSRGEPTAMRELGQESRHHTTNPASWRDVEHGST